MRGPIRINLLENGRKPSQLFYPIKKSFYLVIFNKQLAIINFIK